MILFRIELLILKLIEFLLILLSHILLLIKLKNIRYIFEKVIRCFAYYRKSGGFVDLGFNMKVFQSCFKSGS